MNQKITMFLLRQGLMVLARLEPLSLVRHRTAYTHQHMQLEIAQADIRMSVAHSN